MPRSIYYCYSKKLKSNDKYKNIRFYSYKANHKWTTDITEFRLYGTKVYLTPILDMYYGEIISFDISYGYA